MAFDACMVAAVTCELRNTLAGARVEKVQQPQKDTLILILHKDRIHYKLLLCASGSCPRISLTETTQENPRNAPMFCMQLRKHLGSAHLTDITQPDFERVIRLTFDGYDEMGFAAKRYLICEIMGKYSNVTLCDGDDKILGVLRPVDFSTSQKRQLLPGMTYRMPPSQNKTDPRAVTQADFTQLYAAHGGADAPDRFLTSTFLGIAPVNAREIACRAVQNTPTALWESFSSHMTRVRQDDFVPVMVRDMNGRPIEYSCFPIFQYENGATVERFPSFGALLDAYCADRERIDSIRQRASDLFRLLTNAQNRLHKKIALQESDLAACASYETYRALGDLITANLYQIRRGDTQVTLINYYSADMEEVTLTLDSRLTPAQNAQAYYKKYTKSLTAQRELTKQLELAREELAYLSTIQDALKRALGESDLTEIRDELSRAGYGSRMHNRTAQKQKMPPSRPLEYVSGTGLTILCGRNNMQNDRLTFHTAEKSDYWFHVKNAPGSHVILLCNGREPDPQSMTEAAVIAACQSSLSDGDKVPVDYTQVRNLKKPPAARPGYVTYSANQTAYVTPDRTLAEKCRKTK